MNERLPRLCDQPGSVTEHKGFDMKNVSIAEFLDARWSEEESLVRAAIDDDCGQDGGLEDAFDQLTKGRKIAGPLAFEPSFGDALARLLVHNTPRRILADLEAKRRLLEFMNHEDAAGSGLTDGAGIGRSLRAKAVLRILASPYRDHPDYREEWAI